MWFDLIVVAFIVAGIITGAWKGLSWQLAGIGSVVLGVLVAYPTTVFIVGGMEDPSLFVQFLVFAGCYGGVSLGCYGVALFLRRRLEEIKLQRYDRHMGAFVGAFHGLALWSMLVVLLIALVPPSRDAILTRPTGKLVGWCLDLMHGILPDKLSEVLKPYMVEEKKPEPPPQPAPEPQPQPQPQPQPSPTPIPEQPQPEEGTGNEAPAPSDPSDDN
jgi:uncharacterized membrane protein required for colicin V production